MGKKQYDSPTTTFPYKIPHRLNLMSIPRRIADPTQGEGMPCFTPYGTRCSALRAHITDRVNEASWPYTRRFLLTKRLNKHHFSKERMERIDRMLEFANATIYAKLANCVLDLKQPDGKSSPKRKKAWTESDWKKHMDYIGQIAKPKPCFEPPPIDRGIRMSVTELLPRLTELAQLPENKVYRRPSQEPGYKDPLKVSPAALKYVISERVKKLAEKKKLPEE